MFDQITFSPYRASKILSCLVFDEFWAVYELGEKARQKRDILKGFLSCSSIAVILQLFQERLKAYVSIPKGFMGNGCLQLSDGISPCFSPQEKESIKNL